MPSYAYVDAHLGCPNCQYGLADLVSFQWAFLPGRLPRNEYLYRIGDALRWKECADGSIVPWAFFKGDGINAGDPSIRDLIARDSFQLFLTEPCPKCGAALGGAAIEIRSQRIARTWLALAGEFAEDVQQVDIYTFDESGNRLPRRDLSDHALMSADDCLS